MTAWLRSPLTHLSLAAGLVLVLALAWVSWLTVESGDAALYAELNAKAQVQGEAVRRKVERAFDYGVPAAGLSGLGALHDGLAQDDPHLAFLAITTAEGDILHAAGDAAALGTALGDDGAAARYLVTRLPLSHDGALVLGHDREAVLRPLTDIHLDIATVLVVSLALSFELLLLVITLTVVLPARTAERVLAETAARRYGLTHGQMMRDELGAFLARLNALITCAAGRLGRAPRPLRLPRLIGVRLLAFLFVFAEELARPIMPTFFAEITGGGAADGQVTAGIAMAVHMLVIAIAMPIGSVLYQHVGRLPLYVGGALLATVGLAGTGFFADGLWSLTAWRALSGLGYAATFVACQGVVLDSTGDGDRVQGSAMMVGGIMLADICGPAIGGIIAAHVGAHTTFILGAAVGVVAACAAALLLDRAQEGAEAPPRLTRHTLPAVLGNGRLMALLLLAAVPAKLVLTGFLFFLVPIVLRDADAPAADTGRVIMLYGLAALVAGPILARLTDRLGVTRGAVTAGGLLTAAGLLQLGWAPGMAGLVTAVVALGLAQSLSIPAQLAAALQVADTAVAAHGKGPVLAVLRVIERLGAAAGPLVAAGLAATFGTAGAVWMLGIYAGISSCLLLLVHRQSAVARPA